MKPLRFTSSQQEDAMDYEPIGSSIKFDTQDDELERIINLRANAVKNDIQKIRDKNRDKNREDSQEEQIIELKSEKDEQKIGEVADKNLSDHEPMFKFGQNFDFENLPALKPIDDEPVKIKEAAETVKFDGFIEPGDLEAKKHELSENLQAINEALSEIDALDEMPPKKDEFDETAKATAQEQSICDETPDVKFGGDNVSLDDLGIKFTQEEVGMQQHPSEKDQILDFFQNEFSIVQDEENKDIEDKIGIINNDGASDKNEINAIPVQLNLNVGFGDDRQNKEQKNIDESINLRELQAQNLEPNFTQMQTAANKVAAQVQTINDRQENQTNTLKKPEVRPVKYKDRAALLAELGIGMEDETFGMPIRTTVPQSDEENEKKAEMKVILDGYLTKLIELGGSDLHVKSSKVVRGRFNGEIFTMGDKILDYDNSILLAKEILGANYYNLMKKKSVDFTYKLNDDYRFRSNVFLQMDGVSFVFRTIPTKIPTMSELLLPPVIEKLCNKVNRGIILVTGPTGSGKTTTLASMINHLNHTKNYHIVTIEDPIEFIYNDDKSVINQRGIGQDVDSFADALRASLREDPDVIFVGEMRDLETVRTAINAAETGHLVLATLHTLDAKETIGRVINMFPKEEQNRIRMTFASVAEAIISQRLVVTTTGKRRVACEIMVKNIRIRDMILEDRDSEIYDAIEQSKNTYGMQTFEQHLLDMYTSGIITKEEALKSASRRENLDIKIKSADLAKKRAMVASIEEDAELLKEFQSEVIALKDIK
ncbi:PilT/PilU family type 4a pilus ATPase [uncultured Campylobacter sp.]|uniref:type IV pilus twitching motility protein PilT n=1 Tax=uncultured Campylobacter sp. TaxID=218934 RepID=UPI00261A87E3|nr:PilT/PilU family type 4a pilus ATPase [uncultured Campylobacter sp.]